jgi:hypothetical protein
MRSRWYQDTPATSDAGVQHARQQSDRSLPSADAARIDQLASGDSSAVVESKPDLLVRRGVKRDRSSAVFAYQRIFQDRSLHAKFSFSRNAAAEWR